MAIACPLKSLKSYKDLVAVVGENTATALWVNYDGVVPEQFYSVLDKPSVVKEGVDFVFEQNPELAEIGTTEEYSKYLDTIFPDSKVKDIVYHNTKEQFETFDKSKLISDGFYFTPDSKAYKHAGNFKMLVLLNLKNPITDAPGLSETINKPGDTKRFSDLGYDGIVDLDGLNEYIVFEPEQIHILGSKQDIEGFKSFASSDKIFYAIKKQPSKQTITDAKSFIDNLNQYFSKIINRNVIHTFNGLYMVTSGIDSDRSLRESNHDYLKKFNDNFEAIYGEKAFTLDVKPKTGAIEVIPNQKAIDEIIFRNDVDRNKDKYQLRSEKPKEEVNKDLDIKLRQMLSELGITIKSIEEFQKNHDVDAIGISDIIEGIIYINENEANLLTLPEETSHFIIELLGESALAKRLLVLVEANDYYKEVIGDEYDAYESKYKGDKNMLVKEAAGKLLSRALVAKFSAQNSSIPVVQLSLMQRLWYYTKNLFNRITKQRFNEDIASAYGQTADQFLKGKLTGLNKKNLTKNLLLFAISDKAKNSLRDKLVNATESIGKRITVYKKKNLKKLTLREEESLSKLVEDLDDKKYMTAALNVAESAKDAFKGVVNRIKALQTSIDNLELVGTDGLLELASTLRDMKSFTNSYLPMLKDIRLEMTKMGIEDADDIDIKNITTILDEIISKAELLDAEYFDMALPIYEKYITPFIGNGPIENIKATLQQGGEDITFLQRWIDSMANSGEPMLQIIDVVVKDAKQEARDEAYNIMKDIIAARMKLEEAGIKDAAWMYERKADGSLSGNNVYEWNYGDWNDARDAEIKATLKRIRTSNKGLKLPDSDTELMAEVFANEVLLTQYNKLMNSWYRYNSQKDPDADAIIAHKKATLSAEDYQEWIDENTKIDEYSGETHYRRELSSPSDKYKNKQYAEIMSNPAKKEFYEQTIALKEDLDSKLPQNRRLGQLAPQLRTDFIEKAKASKSVSELARNASEAIREQFQNVEDDADLGDRFKLTDENGKPVSFLPIYFTGRLDNTKDLSTDFAEAMSAFATMATDHSKMSKIIDMLELGRDILTNRPLLEKDSSGNVLKESINILGKKVSKLIKKDTSESNLKDRLDDYFVMNVYGKTRKEGHDINILGYKINSEKALDLLGQYTSLNNLALNIYAGIQNPLVGNAAIRLEAIAGQFFGNKALLEADKKYYGNLAQNMASVGSRNPKDWLSLWMEKLEVMQDFSRDAKNLNMDRKSLFSKLFNQSSLYFLSKSGEHQMQNRTSLALAYETKLTDKDGKDITLLDAFDTVGNKFVLKSGLKNLDGTAFNEASLRRFKMKQNAINNRLHGIYNDQDLLAIQQYGLMRQALMFRKFMRPGYLRRFAKADYSYEGQFKTEGYYRTFGRFVKILARDLKHGQFILASRWKDLSPADRYNMVRTIADAGYMAAIAILIQFVLPMIGGDDEDNWLAMMTAYQANRLSTELRFYIDPRQTLKILQSPAAGIDQINRVLTLISTVANPWYAFEEIERGKWKGSTRIHKAAVGTIPLYKSISDWMTPEDKLVFFTLQNK